MFEDMQIFFRLVSANILLRSTLNACYSQIAMFFFFVETRKMIINMLPWLSKYGKRRENALIQKITLISTR